MEDDAIHELYNRLKEVKITEENRGDIEIIKEYILSHYFDDLHDKTITSLKEDFIKYAEENGFATYKENASTGEDHPIIWNMSLDVAQYYKKYGETINE